MEDDGPGSRITDSSECAKPRQGFSSGAPPDEPGSDVEHFAFGLIYALGVLSFADARPRGVSGIDFQEKDDWTVGDMLRHRCFERGELRFYADYVRGRCLKTTIVVRADGTFLLETVNRGEAATRWIAKLQGKKILSVVSEATSP